MGAIHPGMPCAYQFLIDDTAILQAQKGDNPAILIPVADLHCHGFALQQGSGKGRSLFAALLLSFRSIYGVEPDPLGRSVRHAYLHGVSVRNMGHNPFGGSCPFGRMGGYLSASGAEDVLQGSERKISTLDEKYAPADQQAKAESDKASSKAGRSRCRYA